MKVPFVVTPGRNSNSVTGIAMASQPKVTGAGAVTEASFAVSAANQNSLQLPAQTSCLGINDSDNESNSLTPKINGKNVNKSNGGNGNIMKQLRKAAGSRDPTVLPAFLSAHNYYSSDNDQSNCGNGNSSSSSSSSNDKKEPNNDSPHRLSLDDLQTPGSDGKNALHMACWMGHISNAQLLLSLGCDINAVATGEHSYGKTPIFFALTRSRDEIVEYLLDYGREKGNESISQDEGERESRGCNDECNVCIVNNKGQSAYSIAVTHLEKRLVEKIQQREKEQEQNYAKSRRLSPHQHRQRQLELDMKEKGQIQRVNPLIERGWVDYSNTHSDGHTYGDLDLRFIDRTLTAEDVVKDGVVNPTTRESRKGNFARNNPTAPGVAEDGSKENNGATTTTKRMEGKRKKKKMQKRVEQQQKMNYEQQQHLDAIAYRKLFTDDERLHLDQMWSQVQTALHQPIHASSSQPDINNVSNDASWDLFSSLLSIIQFWDKKSTTESNQESPLTEGHWLVECSDRLLFLVQLGEFILDVDSDVDLNESDTNPLKESKKQLRSSLSEAAIFCGSGDRHANIVKKVLTTVLNVGSTTSGVVQGMEQLPSTSIKPHEIYQLEIFWKEVEHASKSIAPKDAFLSLIKIIIVWEGKHCSWLHDSSLKLKTILESNLDESNKSNGNDQLVKGILAFCESTPNRQTVLLNKMLTKSIEADTVQSESNKDSVDKNIGSLKKNAKTNKIPDHYHKIVKSLQQYVLEDDKVPSWNVLMNSNQITHGCRYLCLSNPPKWIDSSDDLLCLQTKLRDFSNGGDHRLENFVAFDSEWCTSVGGTTELATIQFSVLQDGVPLAWVVDLQPTADIVGGRSDPTYATVTTDMLRWLFVESDVSLIGFAHRHDLHMISSYIGEEISLQSSSFPTKFVDLQLIAANKMAENTGESCYLSSLPGLKTCCNFFLGGSANNSSTNSNVDTSSQQVWSSWTLSKAEQCSNWKQRPLSASQLEYAGLDAAVLLVLLSEILRS